MSGDVLVYAASLVSVLFVVVFVPIAVVVVLVTVLQRRIGGLTAPVEQWRRCNACSRRWLGVEGTDASRRRLLRRRRARRRARERGVEAPEWARAQGFHRCPSCLSTDVRPSAGGRRRDVQEHEQA